MPEEFDFEMRLRRYAQAFQGDARPSPDLHARIMARVASRAPAGRWAAPAWTLRLGAAAAVLVLLAGAWGGTRYLRAQQLQAAAPRIEDTVPSDGATAVPVDGELRVLYAKRPAQDPTIRLLPDDDTLDAGQWQQSTFVVAYAGLRPATQYRAMLEQDWRAANGDRGHFMKQWSFTTESASAIQPCQLSVLKVVGGEEGTRSGSTRYGMAGSLVLRNISPSPCKLQGRPQMQLRDEGPPQRALTVIQTAQNPGTVDFPVVLKPGQSSRVTFAWDNYCGPRVALKPGQYFGPAISMLLSVPGSREELSWTVWTSDAMPDCLSPSDPSVLAVGVFERVDRRSESSIDAWFRVDQALAKCQSRRPPQGPRCTTYQLTPEDFDGER